MFNRQDRDPAAEPPLEPSCEPETAQQPEVKGLPVSLVGTKAEKLARFGPPINPKDLPPREVTLGGSYIYGGSKQTVAPLGVFRRPRRNGTRKTDEVLDRFVAQRHHASPRSQPGRSDAHIPLDEFGG